MCAAAVRVHIRQQHAVVCGSTRSGGSAEGGDGGGGGARACRPACNRAVCPLLRPTLLYVNEMLLNLYLHQMLRESKSRSRLLIVFRADKCSTLVSKKKTNQTEARYRTTSM